MRQQPDWIDKTLFPFDSRWIKVGRDDMHYIDEGKGKTILFVHGTPEWSFGYRDLIKGLRCDFRCIAIDLLGFGLSDKPQDANYTCVAHAGRLEKLIEQLELKDITIVANDFGGGIALNYAIKHPGNVTHLILFNTWMRSLVDDKNYAKPSKIIRTWLGKFLYLKMNFPVTTIMPSAFGDKRKLTKPIHAHYKKALPNAVDRIAAYTLAKELMDASPWWQSLWGQLDKIEHKAFLFFWGMKDRFIQPYELDNWIKRLPAAKVVRFSDAGHFVQEEKPEEMIQQIQSFLFS